MDEVRKIRLLIAPILFVASLLWGAWLDPTVRHCLVGFLEKLDWSKLIAGGSVVVLTAGYVIGTVTVVLLRLLFRSRFHEVAMSDTAFKQVLFILDATEKVNLEATEKVTRSEELFVGVAFDHGILQEKHKGIHEWLFRRWSAFTIAANSACGLVLSLLFGYLVLKIQWTLTWLTWGVPVVIFAFILLIVAYFQRSDTMKMLNFMAGLLCEKKEAEKKEAELKAKAVTRRRSRAGIAGDGQRSQDQPDAAAQGAQST